MNYENLVRDFAIRTRKNLNVIRDIKKGNNYEVYEVTQLINSMLGLIIFPQQRYVDRIPKIQLEELIKQGWPTPKIIGNHPQVKDLNELIRYLRNAISHCNLEFISKDEKEISGVRLWNMNRNIETWRTELSINDIEVIIEKFIDLLNQEN
jgi:hypothetical protein